MVILIRHTVCERTRRVEQAHPLVIYTVHQLSQHHHHHHRRAIDYHLPLHQLRRVLFSTIVSEATQSYYLRRGGRGCRWR